LVDLPEQLGQPFDFPCGELGRDEGKEDSFEFCELADLFHFGEVQLELGCLVNSHPDPRVFQDLVEGESLIGLD